MNTLKKSLFSSILIIFFLSVFPQNVFAGNLKDYFPVKPGARMVFISERDEQIIEKIEETQLRGRRSIIINGRGYFTEIREDNEGIKLVSKYLGVNFREKIDFDKPILIFPFNDEFPYVSESGFRFFNEKSVFEGVVSINVDFLQFRDVEVAAGKFRSCLELSLKENYKSGFYSAVINRKILYAVGVGKIREDVKEILILNGEGVIRENHVELLKYDEI